MSDAESGTRSDAPADPEGRTPGVGEVVEGVLGGRSRQHFVVFVGDETWRCVLRGKVRDDGPQPLVGDRVRFRVVGEGEGAIEYVFPRRNVLSRLAGHGRRVRQHSYCANVDNVLIVTAAQEPPFRPALVDRLLISARSEDLTPIICLNKIDLDPAGEAFEIMEIYRNAGYEVLVCSALSGTGVAELSCRLAGAVTVLSGHSGVGKTSLLMRLIPGFSGETRTVSKRARGRHSTTEVSLVRIPSGGYVVDTPGFREFTVWGVALEDIASYYPEFLPFAARCKYHNCLHLDDPQCAVVQAVEDGAIPPLRYENYLRLLETHGGV